MHLLKARLQDNLYRCGLISIAASLFFFCLPFFAPVQEGQLFGLFVANFAITWVYFFMLLVNRKRLAADEGRIHYTFLFLTLFLISAFGLNREMTVFEDSVNWFSALLVVSCINYLGFAFADALPKRVVHTMFFVSGISWITFIYLTAYLLPLSALGVAGFFLFGVSLHAFVPGLFSVYSMLLLNKAAAAEKKYWWSFFAGTTTAVAFVLTYAIMWNNNKVKIDEAWHDSVTQPNDFPAWVNVAQQMPDNFFTRRLLRTNLVYSVPTSDHSDFFWGMPGKNIGEKKKHDPLVMTSEFLFGKMKLNDDDKIKILESRYRLNRETQDRLWSGDHLSTENVNTEVRFWPDCNITYTEKTVTVLNNNSGGFRPEEAIYTFYMPEGAVVTSLSLWIHGKEEKGILTSKGSAESAYKSIVGVERRDPSIVQWQEGNTVSVRVFPVAPGESRKFKIGITAPLERVRGKLRYENIYFDGPFYNHAKENILIDFEQPADELQTPASFTSMSKQSYQREGRYTPQWSMLIKDPGLSHCSFSFDDKTYSLFPYQRKLCPVSFDKIYLDINKSWSRAEFDSILVSTEGKEVFVFDSALRKLDDTNKDELWTDLHAKQFSLFPLFEIENPAQSLLITKNDSGSPSMDDLDGTDFMEKTKSCLQDDQRINLFDLGADLSPYLKSLKELRVFQYDKGDIADLQDIFEHQHFPDDVENDHEVIIHKSDMVIRQADGTAPSQGPDHLMRLFAYNHVMQQLGRGQIIKRAVEDRIIEEARKAYVVTPVSSLVVLETQDDYDRFKIQDADVSLKNASLHSKGSAPEPHEWAIIIMVIALLGYFMRKNKLRYS